MARLVVLLSACVIAQAGCSLVQSDACSVVDNDDGTYTITCPDGSEVTVTPGEPGEDGFSSLVKLEEEPPGSNCRAGGVAVHSGRDLDGDGILDPDEIEATQYICHGEVPGRVPCEVLEDSMTIRNSLEWKLLVDSGCKVITGDLIIEGIGGIEAYSFPTAASLEEIGGSLIVRDNPALESLVGLDALVSVGGALDVSRNNALRRIEGLVSLSSVGGDVLIQQNPSLESLDGLQALTSVGGEVFLDKNYHLTTLQALEGLTSAAGLVLTELHRLTSLQGLESLTSLDGRLYIFHNYSLTDLEGLAGLRSVGGHVIVSANPQLTSLAGLGSLVEISGSLLIGAPFWLGGNYSLTEIGLRSLSYVGGELAVQRNAVLPECLAWELHDQLEAANGVAGRVDISDNDTTATCE